MSKIRLVRQRTDAPRQDEGPSTGAMLLAGAVLGLATDAVALALPRHLGRPAPQGPRAHPGAVLVPAALHRLRRGPRCAAAHRSALAAGQLGQRFVGRHPGIGSADRQRAAPGLA
jgi:hypothetical protein